jgi:hypothetical protein
MLLERLQEICGIYGDAAGAQIVDGNVKVFPHAINIAKRSVVIDYGKECHDWEMYPIAKRQMQMETFALSVANLPTDVYVSTCLPTKLEVVSLMATAWLIHTEPHVTDHSCSVL